MSIIALLKDATLKSGAVASYWKVIGANYSETDVVAKVYIAGYISQEKYDDGADPLVVQAVELPKEMVDQIRFTRELPTKAFLYSLLSALPIFKDAKPVISAGVAKVIGPLAPPA